MFIMLSGGSSSGEKKLTFLNFYYSIVVTVFYFQVRDRLPKSIDTLRLLESLSPYNIVSGKAPNIIPLLQRFRSLAGDVQSTDDEFRLIPRIYKVSDLERNDNSITAVDFWLEVNNNKDAAGNNRFGNIALFALNLFSMPFSNASVERVFSAMALIKNNLRNRLNCQTVEAVLSLRYGLNFLGVKAPGFVPTKEMLVSFNAGMYEDRDENIDEETLIFENVEAALDALETM